MYELAIIIKIFLVFSLINTLFNSSSDKEAALKERRTKLLSVKRDANLSEEERSALSELYGFDVGYSEVYYITEPFEVHVIPDDEGKTKFLALADYPVAISDKAIYFLDTEDQLAEVVVVAETILVLRLNDYYIVDEINNTLANAPSLFSKGAEAYAPSTTQPVEQGMGPATHPAPQTVLKSERPATQTEVLYLSPPFYNFSVPLIIVVATSIFAYISKIDIAIEPVWLAPVALLTVTVIALLILFLKTKPKYEPSNIVITRYFGKIESLDSSDRKTWLTFTEPNGKTKKAWMPSHWQNTVSINKNVYFEIEQNQSTVVRIGLNEISERDFAKRKPQYLTAAVGLLCASLIIAFNTKLEWRDAALTMLKNSASYQINTFQDWASSDLKVGDHLLINQPRLCLDSFSKDNALLYCNVFKYALTDEDFQVVPNTELVEEYKDFISNEPDYTPDVSEGDYMLMMLAFEVKKSYSVDNLVMYRRSELAIFTVKSLMEIANHLAKYCPTDAKSEGVKTDNTLATGSSTRSTDSLAADCSAFKQEFSVLWREATKSHCSDNCWDEALQGGEFANEKLLKNSDSLKNYQGKLHNMRSTIWRNNHASLKLPTPKQNILSIQWMGPTSADLQEIAIMRANPDPVHDDVKIETLNRLIQMQAEVAYQRVDATILKAVNNDEGQLTLILAPRISSNQAMETVINHAFMALFGLTMLLLLIMYWLSSRPHNKGRVKSENAWIS
ncbi:hypothetical protein ACSI5I_003137 [Vibrio vulnificus]